MLFSPCALESFNSIEKMRLRTISAIFNSNTCTTIICYAPTNASDQKDDIIYNELSSFVHSIPKHNVLIISGDIDAQIGKNKSN